MNIETISELQKPLVDALERLQGPVEAFSLLALANEFYTKDERVQLYARYVELVEADNGAHQAIMNSGPDDKLGWEQRVKMFGEAVAQEQMAPRFAAMDKRQATMADLSKFQAEHGLIVRLIEKKLKLQKRS